MAEKKVREPKTKAEAKALYEALSMANNMVTKPAKKAKTTKKAK